MNTDGANTNIDYEEEYCLADHHKELLDIMILLDKCCRANGIGYSLDGGTLLGAVRHGGFIPWDDDADVSMTRENYEAFVAAVDKGDSGLKISHNLWIPRIEKADRGTDGVNEYDFVDLFIYDKVPKSAFGAKVKRYKILMMQGIMHEKAKNDKDKSFGKRAALFILWLFGRLFTKKFKFRMYHRISKRGSAGSGLRMIYNDTYKRIAVDNHTISESLLESYTDLPFSSRKMMAFEHCDELLKMHFGDYMKWPPEEKRKPEHLFIKLRSDSND